MRRRVKPRFWVFMIVVTLVVFVTGFSVAQVRYRQNAKALREARAYRDQLALQVDELSNQLKYAQTDAYVERVARDELGMIMPGEVRYVNGGN